MGINVVDRVRIYANGKCRPGEVSNDSGGEECSDDEECVMEKEELEEPILAIKESLACGLPIENEYYPSGKEGTRGKRVKVKHICYNCYSDRSFAENKHVEEKYERGGRSYLPICMVCLNSGVPVRFRKGGRSNVLQASAEKKRKREQQKVAHKRGKR